jgi:hypothetical protein
MELYRIGDRVVSRDKLDSALDTILRERSRGATQAEAARTAGVARSFVSNLETLGEVRRGARIALIAFPVSNGDAVRELAGRYALDLVLIFSQDERVRLEDSSARDIFNRLLDTLAELNDFDAVLVLASDWRLETFRRVLDTELIGIKLGTSPLNHDTAADLEALESILQALTERSEQKEPVKKHRSSTLRLVKEWYQSKKS